MCIQFDSVSNIQLSRNNVTVADISILYLYLWWQKYFIVLLL